MTKETSEYVTLILVNAAYSAPSLKAPQTPQSHEGPFTANPNKTSETKMRRQQQQQRTEP